MRGKLPSETRWSYKHKKKKRPPSCSSCIKFGDGSPTEDSACEHHKWGLGICCSEHERRELDPKEPFEIEPYIKEVK